MLEIGSLVDGKYKILNKVGQGGMSVVYLAMNEKANKQWAVKEVRKDGVKDFEVVKQGLVAETDILKKLSHPNLPSIIDVIDQEDSFIIIMDYIQGNSLNKALDEFGAQPQENVIEWAKQLCDVLGYLHSRNPAIIYRDMKPANIMLKPDGNVTLIDFGTAREFKEKNLADTTCLGTVGYAAPEQFGGMGQTDARTDIYCLGATLYHLVTGMNPCEPPYEIKPIRQINPSLSSGLERIILKCTQRNPNDRYQSAEELMYALEHHNEIDDIYRKKQKKKLGAFLTTSMLTVAFAGISVLGHLGAQSKQNENYEMKLAETTELALSGEKAQVVENYYETILLDPTRTEAYLGSDKFEGMIAYLLEDDVLDSEDNGYLVKLNAGLDKAGSGGYTTTVNVLEQLKLQNLQDYEDVCNAIGEAYLFYYDIGVGKDKYVAASKWFQYAGERYPAAEVYCNIAECLENIAKYEKSTQSAKAIEEYKNLWNTIQSLQKDAQSYEDDLKLRIWNESVNMIKKYANEFVAVAGKKDTVISLIDKISEDSNGVSNTFLKDELENLRLNVEDTKLKLAEVEEG